MVRGQSPEDEEEDGGQQVECSGICDGHRKDPAMLFVENALYNHLIDMSCSLQTCLARYRLIMLVIDKSCSL